MADHLFVSGFTEPRTFQSAMTVIPPAPPVRNRAGHGAKLLADIDRLERREARLTADRLSRQLPKLEGTLITLQMSAGTVVTGSLQWSRDGIEVVKSLRKGDTEYVSLFVPAGKLSAFKTRVTQFLNEDTAGTDTTPPAPRNARLVTSIETMAETVFDHLWSEGKDIPPADEPRIFQIWLRVTDRSPRAAVDQFLEVAAKVGIQAIPGYLRFPDRVVVAVQSTRKLLEQSLELLDLVAEIRDTSPTAEYFIAELTPFHQAQYAQDLIGRLQHANPPTGAYVTVLDTGLNQHPLLRGMIDEEDILAARNEWNANDHDGHGTAMAGIAAFGDLTGLLSSTSPVNVPHRLESVKLLPAHGANPPHLYGWVTEQAAQKAETRGLERRRVFSMSITCGGDTMGFPSEWSATIDRLACGYRDTDHTLDTPDEKLKPERQHRLFCISAGNVQQDQWNEYPQSNDLHGVEDPGQAWNALTVGAFTTLSHIDDEKWPGRLPIAGVGGLAPASRTSLTWVRSWPLKPDVVAEGGNGSFDIIDDVDHMAGPESLRLVTLGHQLPLQVYAETGDTSAANAEVARLCAHTAARYPSYWAETIRALVIHGAQWTAAMTGGMPKDWQTNDKMGLLRRYGYGAINATRTLESGAKNTTLILQETLTPYHKGSGQAAKLGDMNLHELPWPEEALLGLGETRVSLRVTLSYFVDPNPAQRGWRSRFRYQSYGLRLAVKASTEDADQFLQRINLAERDEDDDTDSFPDPDFAQWLIGSKVRSRGSVHSDVWTGTGAQLAVKSHIAVLPVGGWWKDTGGHDRPVRYSLVVSLEVETATDTPVDFYTPIVTEIEATTITPPIAT